MFYRLFWVALLFSFFSCAQGKIIVKSEQDLSKILKVFSNHRVNFFLYSTENEVLTNLDFMNQVLDSLNIENSSFGESFKEKYPKLHNQLTMIHK